MYKPNAMSIKEEFGHILIFILRLWAQNNYAGILAIPVPTVKGWR
jgi:hypothetical protein